MPTASAKIMALVISPSAVTKGSRKARAKHSRARCRMKPMAKPEATTSAREARCSLPEFHHSATQATRPSATSAPSPGKAFFSPGGGCSIGGARVPQSMCSSVHSSSLKPTAAPASRPTPITQPAGDECSTGLKNPPVVQPPASAAPMPIRMPPSAAQRYSIGGGRCKPN